LRKKLFFLLLSKISVNKKKDSLIINELNPNYAVDTAIDKKFVIQFFYNN